MYRVRFLGFVRPSFYCTGRFRLRFRFFPICAYALRPILPVRLLRERCLSYFLNTGDGVGFSYHADMNKEENTVCFVHESLVFRTPMPVAPLVLIERFSRQIREHYFAN